MNHITGVKYANEERIYGTQNNNAVEKMNLGLLLELQDDLKKYPLHQWPAVIDKWIRYKWKESCSSESMAIILEGIGIIEKGQLPDFLGLKCQSGDHFTMHLNNPLYDNEYSKGRKAFDNRSIYNWQKLLKKIGIKSKIIKRPSFMEIRNEYLKGNGAMLNRPGHYVAGIGHDLKSRENVHHDPNGKQFVRENVQQWQEAKYSQALIVFGKK